MDIEDFMRQTQPKAKRSRLELFKEPILLLNSKGYANWQVREWLVSNGVVISTEGLRKFINKQKKAVARKELPTSAHKPDSLPTGENDQNKDEEQDNVQTAFNPSDLREIREKKIDLAALSKIGKDLNRQRKKDENSRD